MNFKLIDCHTHVNSEFYKNDWREVLTRSLEAGVGVVNIGTNLKDSQENIAIAEEFPDGVYATVGLHPTEKEEFAYEKFVELAKHPKVVGIGECGLDYFREENKTAPDKERQIKVFKEQIKLAREVGKPLMLHLRGGEAYDDAITILSRETDLPKVIFHFFVGNMEQFARINKDIPADIYFTFGGVITFARNYDEVIQNIPLDRILLETDAPFLAPAPFRGKRNEPAYLLSTAEKMAILKDVSKEEIMRQEIKNASHALGIKYY